MLSIRLLALVGVAHAAPHAYGKPPPPPAPAGIAFDPSMGSTMVLQQAPAKACVTGTLGGGTSATVKISAGEDDEGYEVAADVAADGAFKACLKPSPAGGAFTITATCTGCAVGNATATISEVTFGDVWYCGGQSNMALPLMHTLSRNTSRDMILAGKYANLRIHGIAGNMNPTQPWATLEAALADRPAPKPGDSHGCHAEIRSPGKCDSDSSSLMGFSSTCFYYGISLSDELEKSTGAPPPPIGLVHTSFGGSSIEQWLTNETIATCANASIGKSNQEWHDTRVMPYTGMTLKGWIWYQGENDMHNLFGNSAENTGYACLMVALVKQWRELWSITASTTPADAPFGLVTLAPSGGEGGSDIGTMRWAQTGSYGAMPNPAMPNTFLAQAYDLDDPYHNDSCYKAFKCHDNSKPADQNVTSWGSCTGYCESVKTTNWYMGPIHPRDKLPVGQRLAAVGAVVAYGSTKGMTKGHSNGPTISGCRTSGNKITITFNKTMLAEGGAADAIRVLPYYKGDVTVKGKLYGQVGSKMEVLTNASSFCMQQGKGAVGCANANSNVYSLAIPDLAGHPPKQYWEFVDIAAGSAPNEIVVDLTRSNGTAFAIRYGWTGDCCSEHPPTSDPCPASGVCPLIGSISNLPPNPFVAHIVGGKCKCVAPQICDE